MTTIPIKTTDRRSLKEALDLSLLLASHDIDPLSAYCRHCGQSESHIIANNVECFGGGNILAFSHRRFSDRLEEKIAADHAARLSTKSLVKKAEDERRLARLDKDALEHKLETAQKLMQYDRERPLFYIDEAADLPPILFTDLQDPDSWVLPPKEPA